MAVTRRIALATGQSLPQMGWGRELAELPAAWPYVGPTWLAATERAMPEVAPWHTLARRGSGELALLPGYVLGDSPAVDHDPRTYLGWQAPTGESVCGGAAQPSCNAEVDALGKSVFFPALLLGSPLGYRTEVACNFWTPQLFATIVERLVHDAFAAGIRSILAPWIPWAFDRRGHEALVGALVAAGGHATFWGYDDFVRLTVRDWVGHLAHLPAKTRQRIAADERRAASSGVRIQRVDGAGIRRHIRCIAELTCLNREKNGGAGQQPKQIEILLSELLDADVAVRAYLGFRNAAVVASCVAVRKGDRLVVKWAGFDYAAVGERSGLYFAMVLNAPVRDACAEGLGWVEFGAGAHQAKMLRGCQSRAISTALVLADASARTAARRLLDQFGRARRTTFAELGPAARQPRPTPGALPAAPACGHVSGNTVTAHPTPNP